MSRCLERFRPPVFVALAAVLFPFVSLDAEDAPKPMQPAAPAQAVPGAAALDRLKALAGDWIDADGAMGMKDQVAVTYRVTGAGSAVVETIFVGTPHEMVSVYHKDGTDLVMTHYCAAQNQPRMRARNVTGDVVAMEFDGGTNLEPARDDHIHSTRIELVSPDEIREDWVGWSAGKAKEPVTRFHLRRKKA